MPLFSVQSLLYRNGAAFAGVLAFAAGGTFGRINGGTKLFNFHCPRFAHFGAQTATNARGFANLHAGGAFGLITTPHGVGCAAFF